MSGYVPLWTVATPLRETVEPAALASEVMHYSIPALEETGSPALEASDSIKSLKLRVHGGELLVAKLNPRKSRVLIVPKARVPSVASTEFVAFRPTGAEPRFLAYCLLSEATRQFLDANVRSVTRSHQRVEPEVIARTPIPAISLEEQRRIADFLDTETTRLDHLVTLRQRQQTLLAEELTSLLEDELVRPFDEARVPLMNLTDPRRPIQYGIVLPGPDWPGGVPIIKGGDIGARRLNLVELKRTDPEIESRYVRSRVRGGDLVIAIRGSVGEVAKVPEELTGANLTQDTARIAPHGCDANWLGAVLCAPDLQHQMRRETTGATITGINIGALRRLRVPTPPRAEQRALGVRAVELTRRSEEALTALRSSVALIRERRQALITAAVTGQLDVTTARGGAA